jgi:putative endonuclease
VADRRALGRAGEEAATKALVRDGWTLLDRNARTPAGELDLVLERKGVFGFVEVKARRPGTPVPAAEAVDARKAARVAASAEAWLRRHGLGAVPRVLLHAAVELDAGGRAGAVRILPIEIEPDRPRGRP